MAVIEVNVSALRLQPCSRRFPNHPDRDPLRSVSHSPPPLKWPPGLGWQTTLGSTQRRHSCVRCGTTALLPAVLFRKVCGDHDGRGKKSLRSMRFPVYESHYFLNRNVEDILVILEEIKKSPGMPQKSFEAYKVEIQYLRSHATQDVLEVMNDTEIHEMAKLGKQKKAYEDSIRDLDDVYFEVQHREEQRRRQGLPSLIGVLPVDYQPPVSETGEPDDETATSDASQRVHAQNKIKSRSHSPRGKRSARNSRSRRRPGRAS